MPKLDYDTKEKILAAAEKVFHQNGFKGTRTALIATEAGVSRTMLHYHFSTKEALFQEVLTNTLGAVLEYIKRFMVQGQDLEQVIGKVVEVLSDVLEAKPGLPSFIVNLMNESPELFFYLPVAGQDNLPALLHELLEQGKQENKVAAHLNGEDLMLNIYALCSMPYLAATYIRMKENRSEEAMRAFLRQRRAIILDFILKGIKP